MTLVFSLCLPAFAFEYSDDFVSLSGDCALFDSEYEYIDYFFSVISLSPSLYADSLVPFSFGANLTATHSGGSSRVITLDPVSSSGNSSSVRYSSGGGIVWNSLYFYPSNAGSAIITLSPCSSSFSVSPLNPNLCTVSCSVSGTTASIVVDMSESQFNLYQSLVSDPSSQTVVSCSISDGSLPGSSPYSIKLSYDSFGPVPPDPPDHSGDGSMFGWTGSTLFGLSITNGQKWYEYVNGDIKTADMFSEVQYGDASMVDTAAIALMLNSLTYQKWKWKIGSSGIPEFSVPEEQAGSWADMIYRTSVYNYFWQNKLWSDDVSGSWFGVMQSRITQILQVLANDEDLKIKEATDAERQWVQDYFENGSDIADSGKYDKLNSTSSAFKDAFAGAPDSSISDGLTAVNDNGYDFWSASVSADINGESSVSTFSAVPYDQQVRDLYSENFEYIRGGTYD